MIREFIEGGLIVNERDVVKHAAAGNEPLISFQAKLHMTFLMVLETHKSYS
jgi:hypothetical protein